jgi:ATP-binding protein involved in chromosome partitioning
MKEINRDSILNALKNVIDPDLKKDLVSLQMIKNINFTEQEISISVELTTPACPLKDKIKQDCVNSLRNEFPTVKEITVNMTSRVTSNIIGNKNSLIPNIKNTIAVASGKGGVGKSTVSVNIAVALAKEGAKVGLIDADIYGPSVPTMLGLIEKPKIFQDIETTKMIPLENFGISVMSIGFLIDDDAPVIWRGPMASGAIKQFISDVHWKELDYLIFDLPPGTGDIQLTLVQSLPLSGAVIVTTPQNVSLVDVKKALKMFQRVNVPILGMIENMSYFIAPDTGKRYDIFGNGGGKKLSDELTVPFLGSIPINQIIRESGDKGSPVVFEFPEIEESKKIMEISRNLAAQISINNLLSKTANIEISLDN